MDTIVNEMVGFISTQPVVVIYISFNIIAFVENVFPPIPGDVLIAFGGFLIAKGLIDPTITLLTTALSSVVGFAVMYNAGLKLSNINKDIEPKGMLRFVWHKPSIEKVQRAMRKWGYGIVLLNRFMAGTRTVIALMAGLSRMEKGKTLVYSLISSVVWNAVLLYAGYIVGDNWRQIGEYLKEYGKIFILVLALGSFVAYTWGLRRKRKG